MNNKNDSPKHTLKVYNQKFAPFNEKIKNRYFVVEICIVQVMQGYIVIFLIFSYSLEHPKQFV